MTRTTHLRGATPQVRTGRDDRCNLTGVWLHDNASNAQCTFLGLGAPRLRRDTAFVDGQIDGPICLDEL